jgi:hypothetical protein
MNFLRLLFLWKKNWPLLTTTITKTMETQSFEKFIHGQIWSKIEKKILLKCQKNLKFFQNERLKNFIRQTPVKYPSK